MSQLSPFVTSWLQPFVQAIGAKRPRRFWFGMSMLLAVAAGLHVAIRYAEHRVDIRHPANQRPETSMNAATTGSLNQLLARPEFNEVSIGRTPTGQQQLIGWVSNAHDLTELRNGVRQWAIRVSVMTVEEQLRFAHEFLGGPGRHVQAQHQGHGSFYVRAHTHDEAAFRSRLLQWQALVPAVRETQLEHTTVTAQANKLATPVKTLAPTQSAIPGVDGICAYTNARYLTAGQHYIFEGAKLRDGLVVRSIEDAGRAEDPMVVHAPLVARARVVMP